MRNKAAASACLLFEPADTIKVFLGYARVFLPDDHFVVTSPEDRETAKILISSVSENFRREFFSINGGEELITEATSFLRLYRLISRCADWPIIAKLGEEKAETTLGLMLGMLKIQGRGQKGSLLTDGRENIFYIRNRLGILLAVVCSWNACAKFPIGWDIEAFPVTDSREWFKGAQVVSRCFQSKK